LATVTDCGSFVNVYSTQAFALLIRLSCKNDLIHKLLFSLNSVELLVLTVECSVKVFVLEHSAERTDAHLVRELPALHRESLSAVAMSDNLRYLLSVGGDQLVKVWDYDFKLTGSGSSQVFIGHFNAIKAIVFLPGNKRVLTGGGFEGIYEWEFLGDVSEFERVITLSSTEAVKPHSKILTHDQPIMFRIEESPEELS